MALWNKNADTYHLKKIEEDRDVDVLIIGGGMTGLNTAYFLKDFKKVLVVDAGKIGYGVTLGSTAKINYLQSGIYYKIKKLRGEKLASKYLESQRYAIDNLKEIIDSEKIECDLKNVPSFLFATSEEEIRVVEEEVRFLLSQGIDIKPYDLPLMKSYKSYKVLDTYVFNPIKYLKELEKILIKSNVSIYEKTKIINMDFINGYYICDTGKYNVRAKTVVVATQYPYFNMPLLLPLKSYIEKSYIVVSKAKGNEDYTCINTRNPIYSSRFYHDGECDYQLFLSESHNTAFKQNDKEHFNLVKDRFNLLDSEILMQYSNTDIITPDSMPYIGKLKNEMYVACGYNTWGMTNSVLSAKIISDDILNFKNDFRNCFSPKRVTLASIISLPYIVFSQAKSFLGTKINKNKSWYGKNVKFVREKGINYGIFIDDDGVEHRVINKCPHLGCSLIFNEVEKTWDCPCHSSRFNLDGKCIKGPSNYDISIDEENLGD